MYLSLLSQKLMYLIPSSPMSRLNSVVDVGHQHQRVYLAESSLCISGSSDPGTEFGKTGGYATTL